MTTKNISAGDQAQHEILVDEIANRFITLLYDDLKAEQLKDIRDKLPDYKAKGYCPTHNYLDSNVTMAEAFEGVTGREPEVQDEYDTQLMNEAWESAHSKNLFNEKLEIKFFIDQVDFQLNNIKGYISIKSYEAAEIKTTYLIKAAEDLKERLKSYVKTNEH